LEASGHDEEHVSTARASRRASGSRAVGIDDDAAVIRLTNRANVRRSGLRVAAPSL
jgi:hypothetical protein